MDITPTGKAIDSLPAAGHLERPSQFAIEAALIARAEGSVAAGRLVDFAHVEVWLDSSDTDLERPVPYSAP